MMNLESKPHTGLPVATLLPREHSAGSRGHCASDGGWRPLHGLRDTAKTVILAATRLVTSETRRVRTGKSATEVPSGEEAKNICTPRSETGVCRRVLGESCAAGTGKGQKDDTEKPPGLEQVAAEGLPTGRVLNST